VLHFITAGRLYIPAALAAVDCIQHTRLLLRFLRSTTHIKIVPEYIYGGLYIISTPIDDYYSHNWLAHMPCRMPGKLVLWPPDYYIDTDEALYRAYPQ
jgi:hypothetical protein